MKILGEEQGKLAEMVLAGGGNSACRNWNRGTKQPQGQDQSFRG